MQRNHGSMWLSSLTPIHLWWGPPQAATAPKKTVAHRRAVYRVGKVEPVAPVIAPRRMAPPGAGQGKPTTLRHHQTIRTDAVRIVW